MTILLLEEVARKVRPPRTLLVPFRHGYPLDRPNQPEAQRMVAVAALEMLEDATLGPPALKRYESREVRTS